MAIALRVLLAGVFIFSALSKLQGTGLFEIALVDQGLAATREHAAFPARFLIAFELFLGVALLLPYHLKRLILPLVIATLSAFIVLQGYQLAAGKQAQDCGCFGKLLPMSSAVSLLKNVILLGLGLGLFRMINAEKRNIAIPLLLAAGSVAAVLLYAPVRHNYDGNFARYTQFEKAGRVDLTSGDQLVAVFNAECEHCQETAMELRTLAEHSTGFPQIYVLMFGGSDSTIAAFSEKTHTSYPFHVISESEFFDLIGNTPPRVYWLQDGRIKARWDEDFGKNIVSAFHIQTAALSP